VRRAIAVLGAVLALAACEAKAPSALATPERTAAVINPRLVPGSCQVQQGPDGSRLTTCQMNLVPGRTQQVQAFAGMLILGYDRAQLDDPAFASALAEWLAALAISPAESVLTIARQADDPREPDPRLNVLAAAECIHDRNLPENRGQTGRQLRRPGGGLCKLRLSHTGGAAGTLQLGAGSP
jgi:hypothetical protein